MIPTVIAPTYEVKLQSISKPVKYRPYLVKEEKLLLMAQQGNDPVEIEAAVKQLIAACTFGNLDVEALPSFDLELLFLNLRAKSVNNIVELKYECKNTPEGQLPLTDDKVCHNIETISVDLDTVKVVVPQGHTRKIMLTENLGCLMRYPTSKNIHIFVDIKEVDAIEIIANCIEAIYDAAGNITEMKDEKPEDVRAFVESLSITQANKFRAFFETLPHLEHKMTFKCSKCGYTENITLSGLLDFFA